jgi:hypothetical protein
VDDDDDRRIYAIVYDEALRALDLQRDSLEALRTRAGILLSAGAVSTSFLGGAALQDGVSVWAWIATSLFVVFGSLVLRVLWPPAEGSHGFSVPPSAVMAYLADERASATRAYRELALYLEEAYDLNQRRHLVPLTRTFRIATLAVVCDTVAWVVALAAGA